MQFRLCQAILLLTLPLAAHAQTPTPIRLRTTTTISSANAEPGQILLLKVTKPVQLDGNRIIPAGAQAQALITTAKHRGHNHREGQLIITVQSVRLADGIELPLHAAPLQKGTGHGDPIFGPCTFPIPADPVGLFRKGSDVIIPLGTEITAYTTPAVQNQPLTHPAAPISLPAGPLPLQ